MSLNKMLSYLTLFVIGFVLASLFGFYIITHPKEIKLGTTPQINNLPFREVRFITKDGLNISAWLISNENGKIEKNNKKRSVIILIHGYPVNKSDMVYTAGDLFDDFDLLLIDLRSFGGSDGNGTSLGWSEVFDVIASVDYLKKQGYKYVGIYGFSLGGAVALMSASQDKRIDAVASFGSYSNLHILGYENYSHLWFLKYPLVELISLWINIFYGYSPEKYSPENLVSSISAPMLIMHSKTDEIISFRHALRIKEALRGHSNVQYDFFDGAIHGEQSFETKKNIIRFFKDNLTKKMDGVTTE